MEYRRLKRSEAQRLGVSYSAKRMVPKNLKRVTAKTKLLTNRQATQARLGTSKEKFAASRVTRTKTKGGKEIVTRNNLSPRELPRVLRAAKGHRVTLIMFAVWGEDSGSDSSGELAWRHGISEADPEDLINSEDLRSYVKDSGALSDPVRYSVVIR